MEDWRARVSTALGRRVTDAMWARLVERNHIAELEDGIGTVDDVVAEIKDLERAVQPDREPAPAMGRSSQRPDDVHRWAISVLAADRARDDQEVVAYRSTVLDGALIPWDDVPRWAEEQARARPPTTWVTAPIDDDSDVIVIDRTRPVGLAVSQRMLQYSAPNDEWVRLQPTSRGPLEQLRSLAERLAPAYAWTEAQATVFVLADVIPLVSTIRATWGGHLIREGDSHEWARRITLTVDPSIPPDEVARTYQRIRERADHRGRRRLSDKHASLAAFVVEYRDEPWARIRGAWNEQHPEWLYGHDSNFRRDAIRAKARLLYPDWFHGATPIRGAAEPTVG